MTHREIEQGIMEREWQASNWGSSRALQQEIGDLCRQLQRLELEMVTRVCRRAICTFDLGISALMQADWDEDAAVLWLMVQRSRCHAA